MKLLSNEPQSEQIESILATIVRLFAKEGSAKEVAVLSESEASIKETSYDNWNGGSYFHTLFLKIPISLFAQIEQEKEGIEENIQQRAAKLFDEENYYLQHVKICPQLAKDSDWRLKSKQWLNGANINNQGRVRSDNIASKNMDGLLFRSIPEINMYKAFKSLGVSFAPLPVFIRGGQSYRRIEPDFMIIKDGIVLVVEVDGDTVHQESPTEAHDRTTMLLHEGVHIERIRASECDTEQKANESAKKILNILDKHRNVR